MTAAAPLPLAEVTRRAIAVLARELGPADTARFVAQFSGGSGDYTAERVPLFAGRTVAELAGDIRAMVAPPAPPQ
jgi:hypothetical protein